LLLLAVLLPPVAFYLLFIGWLNRRPRPVFASGPWDFAGVLFALSGLLLFGGPALIGSLDERSRLFWLVGEPDAFPSENAWWFWLLFRGLYFAVVAGGAAFFLWRSRRLTAVYNVDADALRSALPLAFGRLGVEASRSGDQYVFADPVAPVSAAGGKDPADLRTAVQSSPPVAAREPAPSIRFLGRPTVLRVTAFGAMRNATLTWEPADAALRKEFEEALRQALAETPAVDDETIHGGCMTVLACTVLALTLLLGAAVVWIRWHPR
jgi:hypothetical protein